MATVITVTVFCSGDGRLRPNFVNQGIELLG